MQLPFLKIHMGEPEPFFATFYFFGTSFTTQLLTKVNSNFPQVQYHGWEILDGLNSNKKQKFKYLQCNAYQGPMAHTCSTRGKIFVLQI